MDLWTSPTDRREPCGPCGQPVDNADALPTACPHSRASRPQAPQDQSPVILTRQHRTTLRRGCLHRPFRTTSASHSNPSQHRPRPSSPPILQAHFRMGLPASCITSRRILHMPSIPRHRLVLRIRSPSRCAQRRERRLCGVCVILIRVRRTHTHRWARRALHSRDGGALSQEIYATFGIRLRR